MTDRLWRKGANGLWSSFDVVIQRQAGKARIKAIGERFAVVMQRNGWTLDGNKWVRAGVRQ